MFISIGSLALSSFHSTKVGGVAKNFDTTSLGFHTFNLVGKKGGWPRGVSLRPSGQKKGNDFLGGKLIVLEEAFYSKDHIQNFIGH